MDQAGDLMSRHSLTRYLQNASRQIENVKTLMQRAKIESNKHSYGYEEFVAVQAFYDRAYPQLYRIVVMEQGILQPSFKGPRERKYEVGIYRNGNHFHAIRHINRMLKVRNYCVDCERVYAHANQHRAQCVAKCRDCCFIGPQFPHKPEDGVNRTCEDCKRTFFNNECYTMHFERACNSLNRCEKCGKSYATRREHVCGERYCRTCNSHHKHAHGCSITTLTVVHEKPWRIIAFDFETTTAVSETNNVKEHLVNYVSARITCSQCEDSKIKKEK